MLVAELRYLGSLLAIIGALLVAGYAALRIGRAAHLSAAADTAIAMALLCAVGYVALLLWLRRRRAAGTTPTAPRMAARYSPSIVSVAIIATQLIVIAMLLPTMQADHWKHIQTVVLSSLFTLFAIGGLIRDWRSRGNGPGLSKITEHSKRRLQVLESAAKLPTEIERRKAIRPLVLRGYGRIALIVVTLTSGLVLAPRYGDSAFIVAPAVAAATFLILHKTIDL